MLVEKLSFPVSTGNWGVKKKGEALQLEPANPFFDVTASPSARK